jgi:hypothetical protein
MLHPKGPALLDIQEVERWQKQKQHADKVRKTTQSAQGVAVGLKLGAIVGQVVAASLGG